MNEMIQEYDFICLGGGPAGQKAAIQAAKSGCSVALVEREKMPGGACVLRGTIPSKTLHETASTLLRIQRGTTNLINRDQVLALPISSMLAHVDEVVQAHQKYMLSQILRNDIDLIHGRARLVDAHSIRVDVPGGRPINLRGKFIVIGTGSRPRDPDDMDVDHEGILDSDSILSLEYLPKSLAVLGGGVIASEYASIFASLGVEVFQIDRYPTPLGFMAPELVEGFVSAFESMGGHWLGNSKVESVEWDGISTVVTKLADGREIKTEKLLFALGRVANLDGMNIEAAGLELTARGLLAVNDALQTDIPHIYGVGDVIGPPSLAASAMEQGRRAVRHALGLENHDFATTIPIGIYSLPELASFGLNEKAAIAKFGSCLVGTARFSELARGQISGNTDGLIRLICDEAGDKLLGVEAVGEGATELIHMGQVALISNWSIDAFVENIFNFPTMAEAYRVAALDVIEKRNPVNQLAPALT
ncbi:MAG: NAD(P) transhydrogenase [Planctomycetota bacterium]|jgi:NAD(P) transhydrogenase